MAATKRKSRSKPRRVRRDLSEALQFDWVSAYSEYLDLIRNRENLVPGVWGTWQRRYGRNYPLFQNEQELALLRAPARILCGTNSYAIGLLEGLTSYVIGEGYTYRAATCDKDIEEPPGLVNACQRIIDEFLQRSEWHGGEQPSMEEELFWRSSEDGEFFLAHYVPTPGYVEVRTVEPEQITQPPGSRYEEWAFGIRTDPLDAQRPLAYWVQYAENANEGTEFSPQYMTHLRRNTKRSIKRGLTDFAFDSHESLDWASKLRSNLAGCSVEQAAIVGVRQHAHASEQEIRQFIDDDADFDTKDYLTGKTTPTRRTRRGWEDVGEGFAYVPGPGANNAPAHLAILNALLQQAGQRWQAPVWLMSGDVNALNYATSLTAESPFVKTILRRQRAYKEAFKRTMLLVLEVAAEAGRIIDANGNVWRWAALQRVIDVSTEAPSPETRNKLEDANRAAIEIPLGLDSRQQYVQRQGRDWDQVAADNQAYLDEYGGDGDPLPDLGEGT